jgi:hydroxyproline O-arabinosyltransferase
VWVWCGDQATCGSNYKHCWLKHLPWVYASKPKFGPTVPWTSGLLEPPEAVANPDPTTFGGRERMYHTVTTAQGTGTQWQMRIHYYWFKKQQKKCRELYGENCHMGGFTRLLHSGYDDELSAEIPTYVVNPLPSGANGYVVRRLVLVQAFIIHRSDE